MALDLRKGQIKRFKGTIDADRQTAIFLLLQERNTSLIQSATG
jgi:hypothetical protein